MMKKFTILGAIFFSLLAFAAEQHFDALQVGTKAGRSTSAVADFNSTTLGLLAPRMTTTQKNAISSPADGLLVFDTTLESMQEYNATAAAWTDLLGSSGGALAGNSTVITTGTGLLTTSPTTSTEVSYVHGVTSAIQTQINTKLTNPLTTTGDLIYSSSGTTGARLGIGPSDSVLVVNGGLPVWAGQSSTTSLVSNNASYFPIFVSSAANGTQRNNVGSGLTFNPSTNNLSTTTFTGALSGNATNVTGTVAIANGGTGQTTKAPAFDALQPMTTSGDLIYGGASGTGTRLGIGSTNSVLTVTGGLPVWGASSGGGGTGVNFIGLGTGWTLTTQSDIDAEVTVGNWLAFANTASLVPGSLTGGSPNSTCLRSTTAGHILNGTASFEFVKSANNRQGEGCSVLVNIPPGYRGQNLQIQAPFSINSGSIAAGGSIILAAYDVTNGASIPVSGVTPTTSTLAIGNMVVPASTAQIRAGWYISGTDATAVTFDFDDVILGPPTNVGNVQVTGPWKNDLTFSPSAGFGTTTGANFWYRQEGDSMHVRGNFTGGTVAASTVYIQLPAGYTIDSTKFSTTANTQRVGYFRELTTADNTVNGSSSMFFFMWYDGSTTNQVFLGRDVTTNAFPKQNGTACCNSSVPFEFEFTVPISQWSGSVTGFNASQVANSWSGYHDNTCSWARTNTAYGDPTADASCALVERVNNNFGTVSTSGSVLPAITFTPSRAGTYNVCAHLQVAGSGLAATIAARLWDGTTTIAEVDDTQQVATDAGQLSLCGLYKTSSTSAVTLSVQTKASTGSATIAAAGTAASSIEWNLFQIDQKIPAPNIVNSVTSNALNVQRINSVFFADTAAKSTACASSPCKVWSQSGSWVSSVTRASTGNYTINFAGGEFSSAPNCVVTGSAINSNGWLCTIDNENVSTSSALIRCTNQAGYGVAYQDGNPVVMCMGPH